VRLLASPVPEVGVVFLSEESFNSLSIHDQINMQSVRSLLYFSAWSSRAVTGAQNIPQCFTVTHSSHY